MKAGQRGIDSGTRDIRSLLWLDRPVAKVVAVVFCVSSALRAATYLGDSDHFWPILLALALTTAGILAIVAVPGDPLPLRTALFLTALGPVDCLLVLPQIPTVGWITSDIWHMRVVTVILCFLSVRGRPWFAGVGAALTILAFTVWTGVTDQGWTGGIRTSVVILAPVLISGLVAATLRPKAHLVFTLRERESERAADEAMTAAVTSEREAQLEALDVSARPILEAAARNSDFTDDDRERAALLEERLRDPAKNWKFDEGDLRERARWDDYTEAYGEAIARCSTASAPWYVVPADRNRARNFLVGQVVTAALEAMAPAYPAADPALLRLLGTFE